MEAAVRVAEEEAEETEIVAGREAVAKAEAETAVGPGGKEAEETAEEEEGFGSQIGQKAR